MKTWLLILINAMTFNSIMMKNFTLNFLMILLIITMITMYSIIIYFKLNLMNKFILQNQWIKMMSIMIMSISLIYFIMSQFLILDLTNKTNNDVTMIITITSISKQLYMNFEYYFFNMDFNYLFTQIENMIFNFNQSNINNMIMLKNNIHMLINSIDITNLWNSLILYLTDENNNDVTVIIIIITTISKQLYMNFDYFFNMNFNYMFTQIENMIFNLNQSNMNNMIILLKNNIHILINSINIFNLWNSLILYLTDENNNNVTVIIIITTISKQLYMNFD